MRLAILSWLVGSTVYAQLAPGGPTQPGLPEGCLGSYPDIDACRATGWSITTPDPCKPNTSIPMPGQQVYIRDELNFCLNLPNPHSIFLQQSYYSKGKWPTIVQAEGYVQSFCLGDYLPPGSLPLPAGGIRSAHVVKYEGYIQVHGVLQCDILQINCTATSPDAFDDGGQYDNGPFKSCGKEPYSGVDNSKNGNQAWENYVEMAGDSQYCMRVCPPGPLNSGPCDVTHDTAGCENFMGVTFHGEDGFTFTDMTNGGATSAASVSLPPIPSPTSSILTATASATGTVVASAPATGGKSSAVSVTSALLPLISLLFL
ncbi:hypothetical protein BC830DRAFT_1095069 [Chytriomyces sp. MP71]|nr:hypothetical protein BC830DRAFT_1095069 [Chytriomyces sp. MP71]